MVMQAGLAALLSRLGAGEDITSALRSQGEATRRWRTWSVFRQHLGVAYTSGVPELPELVRRVRGFALDAYSTRTSLSSGSWTRCSRHGRWRGTAVPGDAAWRNIPGSCRSTSQRAGADL